LGLLAFQVGFAVLVFGLTRAYYLDRGGDDPHAAVGMPAGTAGWNGLGLPTSPDIVETLLDDRPTDDPEEISRRANEYFAARNYAQAADYYRRLLAFDPDNADVRNNLALTLEYLGRPDEALELLTDNVARYPEHQRSWLTLGFVNRQSGDVAAAREALATAVRIDPDSDVGQSAQAMLDNL
jgi:tetratricopeptide (TPR) repeat protein